MTAEVDARAALLDYTDHRGERRTRRVLPRLLWFGVTEWHPTPGWLLLALDLDTGLERDFALAGVRGWRPAPGAPPPGPEARALQHLIVRE